MSKAKHGSRYINLGNQEEILETHKSDEELFGDENKKTYETELSNVSNLSSNALQIQSNNVYTNSISSSNYNNTGISNKNRISSTNIDTNNLSINKSSNILSEKINSSTNTNENKTQLVERYESKPRKGNLHILCLNKNNIPIICIGPDCKK